MHQECFVFVWDADDVRYHHWVGLPGVSTANRLVRMKRTKEIPRWINVGGINCEVWYKGQPVVCDICQSKEHKPQTVPKRVDAVFVIVWSILRKTVKIVGVVVVPIILPGFV